MKRMTFIERVKSVPGSLFRAAMEPIVSKYFQSYVNGFITPYPYNISEAQAYADFRGVFFRMVQMRADMFSKYMSKATVQRKSADGKWKQVEESHPWVRMLARPNLNTSTREFWTWVSLQKDLFGAAVSQVDRSKRVPETLYPIYQLFGTVRPMPDGFGGVSKYVFTPVDGAIRDIPKEDVLYLKNDNPYDPYTSLTLVEIARMELSEKSQMQRYRSSGLANGGVTADIFTTEQRVEETGRKAFDGAMAKYKGVRGKGATLLLDQGVKPIPGMSAKDLEFIDSLRENTEALKFITGLPLAFFDKGTNRAEKEAALVEFIEVTISPMVSAVCDQVTTDFERIFGAVPNVLRIVPPDMHVPNEELEDRLFSEQIKTGRRTPNEWRLMKGLQPLENGDKPLVMGSLVPLESVFSGPETAPQPARSIQTRAGDDLTDDEKWHRIDSGKKKQEKRCESAVTQQFDTWEAEILARLKNMDQQRSALAVLTAAMIFDLTAAMADIEETLGPEVVAAMRKGFESGAWLTDYDASDFNFQSPEARIIYREIMNLTRSIPETLLGELAQIIEKGMADKVSIQEMAVRIRAHFTEMTPWKSKQIAQTTVNSSWEAGQVSAYKMAGITRKRWLSQRDGRVRETHLLADGDVVNVSDKFQVGFAALSFPGDPEGHAPHETINCRCSVLPVR